MFGSGRTTAIFSEGMGRMRSSSVAGAAGIRSSIISRARYDTLSIGDPMRSRSARLTCIAVVWIAIGAAGSFLFPSHKQLESVSDARRAVDQHAREAADALADLRVGQQAYVASGQGV